MTDYKVPGRLFIEGQVVQEGVAPPDAQSLGNAGGGLIAVVNGILPSTPPAFHEFEMSMTGGSNFPDPLQRQPVPLSGELKGLAAIVYGPTIYAGSIQIEVLINGYLTGLAVEVSSGQSNIVVLSFDGAAIGAGNLVSFYVLNKVSNPATYSGRISISTLYKANPVE